MTEIQIKNAISKIDNLFIDIYDDDVRHLLRSAISVLKNKLPKHREEHIEQPYKIILTGGSNIRPFVVYKHYKSHQMDIVKFKLVVHAIDEMLKYPQEIRKVDEQGLRKLGLSWSQVDEYLVELEDPEAIAKREAKEFRQWMKERKSQD